MVTKLSEIIYPELLTTHQLTYGSHLTNTYMLWKLKLTFVLKDYNVHHVVEATNPNPGDPAWEEAERVARYLILCRIDDSLLINFKRHPTVKSFMDHLEATYNNDSNVLKPFLCGKYSDHRMDPGADVNEHVFRMRAMAKLIAFAGLEIPEEVQALALLSSLGDEWEDDVEKVMMDLHATKDALTFDNVGKRLRVANQFRDWRKHCSLLREGASKKRTREKTSASNDDKESIDPAATLLEMFYAKLKSRGQLNYTGSRFRMWKYWICFVLKLSNVDYLLESPDSPVEEDTRPLSKRLSDDFIARHIILGGMSDDLFLTFHDYPTARALMDALESWFGSPSVAQKMVDFSKFTRCEMPDKTDADEHVSEMEALVHNLKRAGVEIPDEMEAQRLIDSLPRSWSDIKSMLRIDIGFEKDEKLADIVRRGIRSADSIKKVFKEREEYEGPQKRSHVKCFSCGKFGHYKSKCPY